LDQQRNFQQEAARRASHTSIGDTTNGFPPHRRPSMETRPSTQSVFPEDQYYSSRTLPAAFPGEYSNYVHHVRTTSATEGKPGSAFGSQTRPSSSQAGAIASIPYVSGQQRKSQMSMGGRFAQQSEQPNSAPVAPMMGSNSTQSTTTHPTLAPAPMFNAGFQPRRDSDATDPNSPHGTNWTPPSQLFHARGFDRSRFPAADYNAVTETQHSESI